MYLDHFGLRTYPFLLTPDTELFCTEGGRGVVLGQLQRAIIAGEGVIKVVGDVGSGKTMLCRTLCQRLPKIVRVALLLNPNLPPGKLVSALLQEFRIVLMEGSDFLGERHALLDYLLTLNRNGQQALVIIEEAHCMSESTIEELCMLSNLETGRAKLVQIVLFGQPALDRNLRTVQHQSMLERCTTSLILKPLSFNQTERYLHSRLVACGYQGEQLFSWRSVRCIHRASKGKMRQINVLANNALHLACLEARPAVANRHVLQAIAANEVARGTGCRYYPVMATAAGVAALLVGGMTLYSWATNQTQLIPLNNTMSHTTEITDSVATQPIVVSESVKQTPVITASRPDFSIPMPRLPYLQADDPFRTEILDAHHWLETSQEDHFTIQLVLLQEASGIRMLEKQLAEVVPSLSRIQLKLFRLKSDAVLICLNDFSSFQEALEVLNRLPVAMKHGNPAVRSVKRLKMTVEKLALVTPSVSG